MAEPKTRPTGASVDDFIDALDSDQVRDDCRTLVAIMRKATQANLTVYLWPQFDGKQDLLAKLGKHSCGKGCLYIKRLSDVHVPTLAKLIDASVGHARASRLGTKMA